MTGLHPSLPPSDPRSRRIWRFSRPRTPFRPQTGSRHLDAQCVAALLRSSLIFGLMILMPKYISEFLASQVARMSSSCCRGFKRKTILHMQRNARALKRGKMGY